MPTSGDGSHAQPHIVLLPSAGMGHLVPFSRLAVALSSGCDVSVAAVLPTVSSAESAHLESLFAAFPAVRRLDFPLAPFDASEFPATADLFFLRFEAMRRSVPLLLGPLLAGAGASALVTDIALASVVIPVAKELRLPCYVLFTASAAMLSLCVHFPAYLDANAGGVVGDVEIPGVYRVPKASVPQALHDPNHLFTRRFVANGRMLATSDGLLVNSFDAFEPEAIGALRDGSVQGRGMVTKGWVEQEEVLKQESVGLFISHCGWNSVTEAAAGGLPVLARTSPPSPPPPPRLGPPRLPSSPSSHWGHGRAMPRSRGAVRGRRAGTARAFRRAPCMRRRARTSPPSSGGSRAGTAGLIQGPGGSRAGAAGLCQGKDSMDGKLIVEIRQAFRLRWE